MAATLGAQLADLGQRTFDDSNSRIKNGTAGAMIASAFALDAAQVLCLPLFGLPFVGIPLALLIPFLITTTGFILFSFWFGMKGVNYFSGKQGARRLLILFGSLVVEVLPFVGDLPAMTSGVVLMILSSRIEDNVGKRGHLKAMVARRQREIARARMLARVTTRIKGGDSTAQGVAADRAEQTQKASYERENNEMAAKVLYGKNVTPQQARRGVANLRGELQAIAAEAPEVLEKIRPLAYNSWSIEKRRKYDQIQARQADLLRLARGERVSTAAEDERGG